MREAAKRHWQVAKDAYQQEKEKQLQALPIHQSDFLPASLSVIERPASPAGRFTIWFIITVFTVAVLWAIIGKLDVVAVAQGKVVANGQTKIVQSSQSGVVKEIFVTNGDQVKADQPLIELDPTLTSADLERIRNELITTLLATKRYADLVGKVGISHVSSKEIDALVSERVQVEQGRQAYSNSLLTSEWQEYQAVINTLAQQKEEKRQERQVIASQLSKLEETLPLLKDQVEGIEELLQDQLVPRFEYLKYKERYIERQKDIVIQKQRLKQLSASLESLNKQIEQRKQEFKKNNLNALNESYKQLISLNQEFVKARNISELQILKSPVDGVVQQLAVHTLGGVVSAGDALLAVVPDGEDLQVEANVLNKDIGFVQEGQVVEVKLEAFPFTKYGVIEGEVVSIDKDSTNDEKLGLIYPARVKINKQDMNVNGKSVPLTPGMSLTAEIKTGKRRIIEFVMAPIFRYQDEALRER